MILVREASDAACNGHASVAAHRYAGCVARDMTVELPTTGGRIEARLMPADNPSILLSVKLGQSGHVVYALPAMLKMGFRIVECSPGELEIMESHGITFASPPPVVKWSTG